MINIYIDNIYELFHNSKSLTIIHLINLILLTIIISIFYGMNSIMLNNVIFNYSVAHIILPLMIIQIINDILFNYNKDKLFLILKIIFDIIEIMMILIFLEIIELNFFKLNKNTKKNITDRAQNENFVCENDSDGSNEEEEEKNTNNQELLNNNTQN